MKKPIIMIMWGSCLDNQFLSQGMMLTKAYSAAITAGGGIPLLPLVQSQIKEYLEMADGLLLPGGMSYVPRPQLSKNLAQERFSRQSDFESELYQAFKASGKPILGICAGCQKINCEEGGTLELDFRRKTGIEHHMGSTHSVEAVPGSLLEQLFGKNFCINSYHGYKINQLGKNLKVTLLSPEGIPEGIEHTELPIFGTQWHPERMRGDFPNPPEGPDMTAFLRHFIRLCMERRDKANTVKNQIAAEVRCQ